MGSAVIAAPTAVGGFSDPLKAEASSSGPPPAGLRLAMISGPAAAELGVRSADRAPSLTLVKTKKKKASDKQLCAMNCDKEYRRCYSQGNQVGKPYVAGGQPCSEQKLMCMRACPQ
jgi:hypothetical protein